MSKQLKLPTLLVVADNPTIRFWVKKYLDDQFFIITAENRQEALDALHSRLDFIIIDSEFEECDALDLCKELHTLTLKSIVPIFLITGRLKKSFREKAMQCGVAEFLSDQLDLDELLLRIESGKKAAALRQKTEDVGLAIPLPQPTLAKSLKNKLVLNDRALKLLASAKEQNRSVSLLLIRIDDGKAKEKLIPLFEWMSGLIQEQDVLFFSAEKLVLLLSDTKIEEAKKAAQTLKEKILRQQNIHVSIAILPLEANEKGAYQMLESAAKLLKAHSETGQIISLDPESL